MTLTRSHDPAAVAGSARAPLAASRGDIMRGALAVVAAAWLFTTSHAIIKLEAADFGLFQLMFFRCFFALVPLAPFLLKDGIGSLRTRRPGLHAARSISGLVSMLCFFYAIGFLALPDITVINFTMPLFVTALSVPLLAERVGWRRWTAVAVGFAGILLMVRPGHSIFDLVNLVALFGAFLYAIVVICMRQLGTTERSATTAFYYAVNCAVVGAVLMPFYWTTPDPVEWVFLILIGLIGGVGQLLMTAAYRFAPAAIIAPFDYTAMIWATLLGFLIWHDIPTPGVWAGAALVIGSGLYILHRETRVFGLRRRAPDVVKLAAPSA